MSPDLPAPDGEQQCSSTAALASATAALARFTRARAFLIRSWCPLSSAAASACFGFRSRCLAFSSASWASRQSSLGPVESVKVRVAGVGSTLPAASVAATANVC